MSEGYLTMPPDSRGWPTSLPTSVQEAFQQLHASIDDMHVKIEHVLSKHESEFLLAYRNHVTKIKKELQEIRKKSEDQEKMFSANDRIQYLEKEIGVFRGEAINIYDKLQRATQELDASRRKYEHLQGEFEKLERTLRQTYKKCKTVEAKRESCSLRVQQLQSQLEYKSRQIEKLQAKLHKLEAQKISHASFVSQKSRSRYAHLTANSTHDSSLKKTTRRSQQSMASQSLQQIFLQCMRVARKQIAFRKPTQRLKDSGIMDIQQFRQADKIKIVELFFSSPQVEQQLFEKMFPSSLLSKVEPKPGRLREIEQRSSTRHPFYLTSTNALVLPRMREDMRHTARECEKV